MTRYAALHCTTEVSSHCVAHFLSETGKALDAIKVKLEKAKQETGKTEKQETRKEQEKQEKGKPEKQELGNEQEKRKPRFQKIIQPQMK